MRNWINQSVHLASLWLYRQYLWLSLKTWTTEAMCLDHYEYLKVWTQAFLISLLEKPYKVWYCRKGHFFFLQLTWTLWIHNALLIAWYLTLCLCIQEWKESLILISIPMVFHSASGTHIDIVTLYQLCFALLLCNTRELMEHIIAWYSPFLKQGMSTCILTHPEPEIYCCFFSHCIVTQVICRSQASTHMISCFSVLLRVQHFSNYKLFQYRDFTQ